MSPTCAFLVGLFAGDMIALFTLALCEAAHKGDGKNDMPYRKVTYAEQVYYILRFWIKERFSRKAGANVKPWAEAFYKGDAWQQCRAAFLASKHYLCERCSTPDNPVVAKIAHHKIYLNERNVGNPAFSLSWENLEALCQECHNKEHHKKQGRRYSFDANGNIIPRG